MHDEVAGLVEEAPAVGEGAREAEAVGSVATDFELCDDSGIKAFLGLGSS